MSYCFFEPVISFACFLLISFCLMYLGGYSGWWNPFLFAIVGAVIILLGSFKRIIWRKNWIFIFCLCVFAGWIFVSFILHFAALSYLRPLSYITVQNHTASWGIRTLCQITQVYLFFPLLLLVAVIFFQPDSDRSHYLCWLSVLFIPSLLLGLYQGIVVDLKSQISGLSFDQSAFGLLLYLLWPLAFLGFISARQYWIKIVFFLLSVLMLWALLMRSQLTSSIGLLLFWVLIPMIWIWAKPFSSGISRIRFLGATYGFLFICLVATGWSVILMPNEDAPFLIKNFQKHCQSLEGGMAGFLDSVEHGRLGLGQTGIWATTEAPLGGWGPGGFYRQMNNLNYKHGEELRSVHNTANMYLQMSSELGIPGLLLFVFIHMFPLWMVVSVRKSLPQGKRLPVAIVWVCVAIMMVLYMAGPHIMSSDVNWVMVAMLGFLTGTGLKAGYKSGKWLSRFVLLACGVMTPLFIFGAYQNSFGDKGYKAIQASKELPISKEYGFYYPFENWNGKKMVWIGKKALAKYKVESNIFGFQIFAPEYTTETSSGLEVIIHVNGELLDKLHFFEGGARFLYYYFPFGDQKTMTLFTEVSAVFNPKAIGLNNDDRDLGIAFSPLQFLRLMPPEGIGFYDPEICEGDLPMGWDKDKEFTFRWTKKRASLLFPAFTKRNDLNLFVLAMHPDLDRQPVNLTIKVAGKIIKILQLTESTWQKLVLPVEGEAGNKVLTFEVDRTWNPKLKGISSDSRDLGIAVAGLPF